MASMPFLCNGTMLFQGNGLPKILKIIRGGSIRPNPEGRMIENRKNELFAIKNHLVYHDVLIDELTIFGQFSSKKQLNV